MRRLFTLNYLALALSLLINLMLFRFNLPMRWFGRYVQEQLYFFLSWAVPLLVLATAARLPVGRDGLKRSAIAPLITRDGPQSRLGRED